VELTALLPVLVAVVVVVLVELMLHLTQQVLPVAMVVMEVPQTQA
jgi:hypothetical protein